MRINATFFRLNCIEFSLPIHFAEITKINMDLDSQTTAAAAKSGKRHHIQEMARIFTANFIFGYW